ncbi:hypothetical protein CR513_60137, partial [Mucuna pruriens]
MGLQKRAAILGLASFRLGRAKLGGLRIRSGSGWPTVSFQNLTSSRRFTVLFEKLFLALTLQRDPSSSFICLCCFPLLCTYLLCFKAPLSTSFHILHGKARRSLNSSSPSGSTARGNDETQQSASSATKVEFPFTILFWEAPESDSEDGRPPSWIDPRVMEVHYVYTQSNSLVGMADAICSRGPWKVRVLPCWSDEVTMFSKLGIKLPFSVFEWAVLRALNMAPTQLHPNSWTFVQTFELLCEDMEREPSLSVFF